MLYFDVVMKLLPKALDSGWLMCATRFSSRFSGRLQQAAQPPVWRAASAAAPPVPEPRAPFGPRAPPLSVDELMLRPARARADCELSTSGTPVRPGMLRPEGPPVADAVAILGVCSGFDTCCVLDAPVKLSLQACSRLSCTAILPTHAG